MEEHWKRAVSKPDRQCHWDSAYRTNALQMARAVDGVAGHRFQTSRVQLRLAFQWTRGSGARIRPRAA